MTKETNRLEDLSNQDAPRYLFHGTSSELSSEIDSNGLKANCEGYAFFEDKYRGAYVWGKMKCRDLKSEGKNPGKALVYYIDRQEIPEIQFELETTFENLSFFKKSRIYKTKQKIPGHYLKKIGKLKGIILMFGGNL